MDITFDPRKNQANIANHGIDFSDAARFDMDSAMIALDDREDYGEDRF